MNTEITDNNKIAGPGFPGRADSRGDGLARVGPLIGLPVLVCLFHSRLDPWMFMWALCVALFLGCKWLTCSAALSGTTKTCAPLIIAYFLLWPGMDATGFFKPRDISLARSTPTLSQAIVRVTWPWLNIFLGGGLVWGVVPLLIERLPWLTAWLGMIGLILITKGNP